MAEPTPTGYIPKARYPWLLTYRQCNEATTPVMPPWTDMERIAHAEADHLTRQIQKNMKLNLSPLAYIEFVINPYWIQLIKEIKEINQCLEISSTKQH